MAEPQMPRLGERLVAEGHLSPEQLSDALAQQQKRGLRLGELLVQEGIISAGALVRSLGRFMGVRGCVLRHGLIDPAMRRLVEEEEQEKLRVLPLFRVHDVLTVAMAEPQSLPAIDALRRRTGCRINPVLALEANIAEFRRKYAGENVDVDEFLATLTESDVEVVERESIDEGPLTDIDRMIDGSPIVNLVNLALLTAVRDGASDIHIEPDRAGTRLRCRVDGVLRDLMHPPAGMHAAIVSRVKVIAKMDIAEKRLPQEGRIRIMAEGRGIDLRVSSMPTLLGEKLVLRILDKENLQMRLEDLGLRKAALASFQRMLHQPHGLVLVTGPTGSGKTTTLYSALDLLRSSERNIVTVEDPVEYQLDLINQIQVHEAVGMTFARALRSILRQDPDVIMVGEIRDEETARVSVQAALTGHLVLATLHTNDAPGAAVRLLDMGIEAYLLSSALNGAAGQRLVRTICSSCATRYYPSEAILRQAGLVDKAGRAFTKGAGCMQCHNSGYQGRLGVYEVMEVTEGIRGLIHGAAPSHELRSKLREMGFVTMREEGLALALLGKTSVEEVLRATHVQEEDPAAPYEKPDDHAGAARDARAAA